MEPQGQVTGMTPTTQSAPMQNQGGNNSTSHLVTMFMNGLFLGVGFYVAVYVGSKVGKKTISAADIKPEMSGTNGYQTMMYAQRNLHPNMNPNMQRPYQNPNMHPNNGYGYRQFDGKEPFNIDQWLKTGHKVIENAGQVDLSKVRD